MPATGLWLDWVWLIKNTIFLKACLAGIGGMDQIPEARRGLIIAMVY